MRGWFPKGLVLQQSSEDCAAPALLIEQYPKLISYRNDENGAFCYFTETSSESIFILLQNAAHFCKWTPYCFLLNCVQDCKITLNLILELPLLKCLKALSDTKHMATATFFSTRGGSHGNGEASADSRSSLQCWWMKQLGHTPRVICLGRSNW